MVAAFPGAVGFADPRFSWCTVTEEGLLPRGPAIRDHDGYLWIGTLGGGPLDGVASPCRRERPDASAGERVKALAGTRSARIWTSAAASFLAAGAHSTPHADGLPSTRDHLFAVSRDGRIGTEGGWRCSSRGPAQLHRRRVGGLGPATPARRANGTIWIATRPWLVRCAMAIGDGPSRGCRPARDPAILVDPRRVGLSTDGDVPLHQGTTLRYTTASWLSSSGHCPDLYAAGTFGGHGGKKAEPYPDGAFDPTRILPAARRDHQHARGDRVVAAAGVLASSPGGSSPVYMEGGAFVLLRHHALRYAEGRSWIATGRAQPPAGGALTTSARRRLPPADRVGQTAAVTCWWDGCRALSVEAPLGRGCSGRFGWCRSAQPAATAAAIHVDRVGTV